jgi:hypothetical protein
VPGSLRTSEVQEHYGILNDRVRLHGDCSATLCPGKHITASAVLQWKELYADRIEEVRKQQPDVIRGPYVFGGQVSIFWGSLILFWVSLYLVWRWWKSRSRAVADDHVCSTDGIDPS